MSRMAPEMGLSRRERRAIKKAAAFAAGLAILWAVFGPVIVFVAIALALIVFALTD